MAVCCTPSPTGMVCFFVRLGTLGSGPQLEIVRPRPRPGPPGCRAGSSTAFCSMQLLLLAVSAEEQVCRGCAFRIHQLFLIWGGKMNHILINATLFIDLGKCLAAPIHLPKANVIRAHIILYLSLGSAYVTSLLAQFL